jgi:hypothetical protein
VFSSLNILQHYVDFDTRTIVTLEKVFGARSFGGFINYLVRRQAILLLFLSRLDLFYSSNYCLAFLDVGH